MPVTCHKCGAEIQEDVTRLLKPGKIDNNDLFQKLFYAGLTHDEIADVFGVSRVAVTNKVKRDGLTKLQLDAQAYEARLSEELMDKIQLIMNQITADKINKASLNQLGTLMGILYDKRTQHERRGTPEISYVGVVHKLAPEDRDMLEGLMKKQTQKLLDQSRKQVQDDTN